MTTKKFAKEIEKLGRKTINFSPYEANYDYILMKNNREIGYLIDNKCFLIASVSLKTLLPDAELHNPVNSLVHQFIEIKNLDDEDQFIRCLEVVYNDLYLKNELITDFSGIFEAYQRHPDEIEKFYEKLLLLLDFSWKNKLLRLNPLDNQGRIIKFRFIYDDLTEHGMAIFPKLLLQFLKYNDRTPNPDFVKMLPKWLNKLETENSRRSLCN